MQNYTSFQESGGAHARYHVAILLHTDDLWQRHENILRLKPLLDEFEVYVVILGKATSILGDFCNDLKTLGFKVHVLPQKTRFSLRNLFILSRFLKQNNIRVLHSQHVKVDFMAAVLNLMKSPISWIASIHDISTIESLSKWLRRCYFKALGQSQAVVCSQKFIPDALKTYLPRAQFSYIPDGVGEHEPLAKQESTFLILSSVRFLSDKEVSILLQAFALIKTVDQKLRLKLLASLPQEEGLLGLIKANRLNESVGVCVSKSEEEESYRQASCFAMPFIQATVLQDLLKAMSYGKAIVTSDIPGCSEILEHEETALLVNPGDGYALSLALKKVVGDESLRDRLGHAALEVYHRDFTLGKMIESYRILYRMAV
jgi:L-malate glycosyltransferase